MVDIDITQLQKNLTRAIDLADTEGRAVRAERERANAWESLAPKAYRLVMQARSTHPSGAVGRDRLRQWNKEAEALRQELQDILVASARPPR